jgi:CheY-like chemotaxis protein
MPLRALIVDDEHTIADSLQQIVAAAGYEAAAAYCGDDALRAAEKNPPDILLTDVLMPGLNGFEVALRIKAIAPSCRLVLFSGQTATVQLADQYTDIFAAKRYRFVLLPKPIHPEALLQQMRDALTAAY